MSTPTIIPVLLLVCQLGSNQVAASNFNLIQAENEVRAELISNIVVPPYLQQFSKAFLHNLNNSQPGYYYGESNSNAEKLFHGIYNENCKGHVLKLLMRSADRKQLLREENAWALQMVDSWGKIPEGILRGHVNSFGDFHECVEIKARDIKSSKELASKYAAETNFDGRYCTVNIVDYGTAMNRTRVSVPVSKQSYQSVGSLPIDSASLNELLSMISGSIGVLITPSVGLCFPNSCSQEDIQQLLANGLGIFYTSTGSSLPTSSQSGQHENMLNTKSLPWPVVAACYEEKKPDFDAADISVMSLLVAFGAFSVLTGLIDYWLNRQDVTDKPDHISKLYNYLMSFSIYANINAWMSTKATPGDFECVHGLRFYSTACIIFNHTYYAGTFLPYWNMVEVKKIYGDWLAITSFNSTYAVDTFFVISGMLVSFNITKTLEKSNGKLNLIMFYVKRYLRLTPTYAILVGVMATLVPYLGSGPYWAVMNRWGNICENNWWTNLLYVNNLVNTSALCVGETWYLATDMQFYILSPFIVYPLWKWEMIGVILLSIYTIISCVTPALIVHYLGIPPAVFQTRDFEIRTAFTHLYIRPYARFSPYLVGIWLGWILFKTKGKRIKLPPTIVLPLWFLSIGVALAVFYGNFPWFDPQKEIPKVEGLAYAGLSRFAWGMVIAWIIFACVKGYGGIVNGILSWKVLRPLARLCYCVYLVSLHLQMVLHVRFTHPVEYDPYLQINFFFAHMVTSFFVGFVMWLLFEAPFLALLKLAFDDKPERKPKAIV